MACVRNGKTAVGEKERGEKTRRIHHGRTRTIVLGRSCTGSAAALYSCASSAVQPCRGCKNVDGMIGDVCALSYASPVTRPARYGRPDDRSECVHEHVKTNGRVGKNDATTDYRKATGKKNNNNTSISLDDAVAAVSYWRARDTLRVDRPNKT